MSLFLARVEGVLSLRKEPKCVGNAPGLHQQEHVRSDGTRMGPSGEKRKTVARIDTNMYYDVRVECIACHFILVCRYFFGGATLF